VQYRSRKYSHPEHPNFYDTKAIVQTWSAGEGAWKDRDVYRAMSLTFTREFGVEDAARQAYLALREELFPQIEADDDRYFPRRRQDDDGCIIAAVQEGESARMAATVPYIAALHSALDRSMLDQQDLWRETERLQAKVFDLERQLQGNVAQAPLPPHVVVDSAIGSSRKRHHPGCTCTNTTIEP
jgi:hypothetical protein